MSEARRGYPAPMGELATSAVARLSSKRKAYSDPEGTLQRMIIQGFMLHGIYAVHYPMERKSSEWERMQQKRNGSAAGFPDLMLYKRPGLHGLMELKKPGWKAPKSGDALKAWQHRLEYHDRLRSFGIPVESCVTSWDEALEAVRAWGWVAR